MTKMMADRHDITKKVTDFLKVEDSHLGVN
jgi:hypothetical protein